MWVVFCLCLALWVTYHTLNLMKKLFWRLTWKGMKANSSSSTGFPGKGVPKTTFARHQRKPLFPTHGWSKTKKNLLVSRPPTSHGKVKRNVGRTRELLGDGFKPGGRSEKCSLNQQSVTQGNVSPRAAVAPGLLHDYIRCCFGSGWKGRKCLLPLPSAGLKSYGMWSATPCKYWCEFLTNIEFKKPQNTL